MKKLLVLGSGDAFASGGKFCTSFYLGGQGHSLLIDCGASTLIRLQQLSIDPTSIDGIVVTHFHGDHYGGIPFLLIADKYYQSRSRPLTIFGPEGVKEQLRRLQEAMYPGTGNLIDSSWLKFVEFRESMDFEEYYIQTKPVIHSPLSKPHGIKVSWSDQSIAFSGDTEWTDHLIDLAKGTACFICECNSFLENSPGHLSYATIMEKRDLLDTKKIYLTHMGKEVLRQTDLNFPKLNDGQEIILW